MKRGGRCDVSGRACSQAAGGRADARRDVAEESESGVPRLESLPRWCSRALPALPSARVARGSISDGLPVAIACAGAHALAGDTHTPGLHPACASCGESSYFFITIINNSTTGTGTAHRHSHKPSHCTHLRSSGHAVTAATPAHLAPTRMLRGAQVRTYRVTALAGFAVGRSRQVRAPTRWPGATQILDTRHTMCGERAVARPLAILLARSTSVVGDCSPIHPSSHPSHR